MQRASTLKLQIGEIEALRIENPQLHRIAVRILRQISLDFRSQFVTFMIGMIFDSYRFVVFFA